MTDDTKTCKLIQSATRIAAHAAISQSERSGSYREYSRVVRNQWPTREKLYTLRTTTAIHRATRCDKPKIKQDSQSAGIIQQLRVHLFIKPL